MVEGERGRPHAQLASSCHCHVKEPERSRTKIRERLATYRYIKQSKAKRKKKKEGCETRLPRRSTRLNSVHAENPSVAVVVVCVLTKHHLVPLLSPLVVVPLLEHPSDLSAPNFEPAPVSTLRLFPLAHVFDRFHNSLRQLDVPEELPDQRDEERILDLRLGFFVILAIKVSPLLEDREVLLRLLECLSDVIARCASNRRHVSQDRESEF